MKKMFVKLMSLILLTIGWQSVVFANSSPTNGQIDCGVIVGNKFYSNNCTSQGIDAVSGICRWVPQAGPNCGSIKVNNKWFTKTPHAYICNVPLDDYIPLLLIAALLLGYFALRNKLLIA